MERLLKSNRLQPFVEPERQFYNLHVFQELSICHSKNYVFLMLIHVQNMHISLLLLEVNEEISKLTTDL